MTITAATFFVFIFWKVSGGIAMPIRLIMLMIACLVNTAFFNVVAGASEADDQTIPHQLIFAHSFDVGKVLDAGCMGTSTAAEKNSQQEKTG